ncbi:hypothetical protein QUF80_01825 [Desulfococcaceae bacterium HSG8]|nr:hypothetical protein [Desulfococcaceae bacterium HSG8]
MTNIVLLKGRPVSPQNVCALCHRIPLVTHNTKNFNKIEKLKIITAGNNGKQGFFRLFMLVPEILAYP